MPAAQTDCAFAFMMKLANSCEKIYIWRRFHTYILDSGASDHLVFPSMRI